MDKKRIYRMRDREPGERCYTLIVLSRSSAGGQETSNDESRAQQTKSMEAGRARSESDRATTCERRGWRGRPAASRKHAWPLSGRGREQPYHGTWISEQDGGGVWRDRKKKSERTRGSWGCQILTGREGERSSRWNKQRVRLHPCPLLCPGNGRHDTLLYRRRPAAASRGLQASPPRKVERLSGPWVTLLTDADTQPGDLALHRMELLRCN